jgi:hypothetical protein
MEGKLHQVEEIAFAPIEGREDMLAIQFNTLELSESPHLAGVKQLTLLFQNHQLVALRKALQRFDLPE